MFKKLLIAIAVLAASSTAAFASVGIGPYMGIGLGSDNTNWHVGMSDTDNDKFGNDLGGHGVVGQLFAGYGMMANQNIYLGSEIFANLASTSAKLNSSNPSDGSSFSDKLSTKASYGASIIPGVMLNDNLLAFARIGVIRTRFDHTLHDSDSSTPNRTDHINVTGGQLGLGAQTNVAPNVDVRGEYVYTAYQSFSSFDEKIKAHNNQAILSLIYKIG